MWSIFNRLFRLKHTDKFNDLIEAAETGDVETVQELLEHGTDVNKKIDYGPSPLSNAIIKGHKRIVELLLAFGADVKVSGSGPSLNLAAKYGYNEIVELLIASRPNIINCTDYLGYTPLISAAQIGHISVVKTLCDHGANIDFRSNDNIINASAIFYAIDNGHSPIVEVLLAHGADANIRGKNGITPLMLAARRGDSSLVANLIKHGAKIDDKAYGGVTAIELALSNNHLETVDMLLSFGGRLSDKAIDNENRDSLIYYASSGGYEHLVRALILIGANVNFMKSDRLPPLIEAAERGHNTIVKDLLSNGAHINYSTPYGFTALILACARGHIDVVRTLIEQGADLKETDWENKTALDTAALHGHNEVVKLLKEAIGGQ